MYVLQLMDHYSAGFGVLIIAIVECVAVSWIYGRIFNTPLIILCELEDGVAVFSSG